MSDELKPMPPHQTQGIDYDSIEKMLEKVRAAIARKDVKAISINLVTTAVEGDGAPPDMIGQVTGAAFCVYDTQHIGALMQTIDATVDNHIIPVLEKMHGRPPMPVVLAVLRRDEAPQDAPGTDPEHPRPH